MDEIPRYHYFRQIRGPACCRVLCLGCIGEENDHNLYDRLAFTVPVAKRNMGKMELKSYETEFCALTG